jgi:hypothetical protein
MPTLAIDGGCPWLVNSGLEEWALRELTSLAVAGELDPFVGLSVLLHFHYIFENR